LGLLYFLTLIRESKVAVVTRENASLRFTRAWLQRLVAGALESSDFKFVLLAGTVSVKYTGFTAWSTIFDLHLAENKTSLR